jgi:hypothetical protein
MMTGRSKTILAWLIIATVVALAILCGWTGCGYISGAGLTYDPNTGVFGGSVTFPVGGDYKQVVTTKKAKARKHKTTNEFK